MEKKELREKYLIVRKEVSDKVTKSDIIFDKVKNLDVYKNAKVIGIYYSLGDEVSTLSLINYSINIGKEVCVPKVVDKNKMEFYQIGNNSNLEKSNFNVLEPTSGSIVDPLTIDLMIVPGIVFSKTNYRVGYGMGYYDKYLVKTHAYKIGLSFRETYIEEVEHNDNDIKLDMVITD